MLTSQKNYDNMQINKENLRIRKEEYSLTIAEANEPLSSGLRIIISKKGFKNLYIAEKAGYTPQELSDMLNGRRLIKACDIPRLAKALDVESGELYAVGMQGR